MQSGDEPMDDQQQVVYMDTNHQAQRPAEGSTPQPERQMQVVALPPEVDSQRGDQLATDSADRG